MKKTKRLYLITNSYDKGDIYTYVSDVDTPLEVGEISEPLTYENATIQALENWITSYLENWNYHSELELFDSITYDIRQITGEETYKRILWQWVNEDSWYGN